MSSTSPAFVLSVVTICSINGTVTWGDPSDQAQEEAVARTDQIDTRSIDRAARHGRLVFTPKRIPGVPVHRTRVVGRHRGLTRSATVSPELYVLLPEQIALTAQAQPSLFWYLSEPVDHPVRLSISTPGHDDSVLELNVDASKIRGIQRLDTAKFAIKLKAGVRYDWVVTVMTDPQAPSGQVYAKSVVWRVDGPKELMNRLMHAADQRERAEIAAEEGVWVDALAGLSDLIKHHPNDSSLRRDRADLLRQAGFKVAVKTLADHGFDEEVHLPSAMAVAQP